MKELWLIFSRSVVKNLKKKDDFKFLDIFDEGEIHRTLRRLAPIEAEFYGE